MLSQEELNKIIERSKKAPGKVYTDSCNTPAVSYGYFERLLNMLISINLYIRRNKSDLKELGEQLKPLFEPAYQAHRREK